MTAIVRRAGRYDQKGASAMNGATRLRSLRIMRLLVGLFLFGIGLTACKTSTEDTAVATTPPEPVATALPTANVLPTSAALQGFWRRSAIWA
ncbi:MAG: hypothetical protein WA996_03785 [Candidatus Promineifilaceae bacterium]